MAAEKGALGVARALGVSAMVEVAVVVEMVDEVATPAEPEAMAVVNAVVNAVGVTEVTWVETEEEERTELVVAADWGPAMVLVVWEVSAWVVEAVTAPD